MIHSRAPRAGLLLALCTSPPAIAQSAPSYNPTAGDPGSSATPAPAPTRGGGYWLPGQPLPVGGNSPNASDGSVGPPPPAGNGESGRGTGEAVVRPEDYASTGISVDDPHAGEPGSVPETHLVKKGDTLWEIASAYYRNPWYWPKLWSYNPVITNPHWIYPGDSLRLKPGDGAAAAALPAVGPAPVNASPASLPTSRISRDWVPDTGLQLRASGFVEPDDLKAAARIAASREEKLMLTFLDEVYLEFGDKARPHPGDKLSVYRVVSDVRRPDTREVMGSMVEIVGELEVRSLIDKRTARAVITEARAPIERRFRVGPLRRRFEVTAPVPDARDVDGQVMASLGSVALMGDATVVFVDRGKDDGLAVGNRMMVVRRGDGYMPKMGSRPRNDQRFPREVMGEVLLVDVRSRTSTGVVMRSNKEVEVGDTLEARKGY